MNSVRVDDWTAKFAIIATNVLTLGDFHSTNLLNGIVPLELTKREIKCILHNVRYGDSPALLVCKQLNTLYMLLLIGSLILHVSNIPLVIIVISNV